MKTTTNQFNEKQILNAPKGTQMNILMAIAFFALAACAPQTGANANVSDTKTVTYQLNGMTPDQFYSSFTFKQVASCDHAMRYRFASSESEKFAVNSRGKDLIAELKILMSEDHTYQALYTEITVYDYIQDGFRWESSRDLIVRGEWKIVEDKLVLSSLGTATGLVHNGAPAMELKMEHDLLTKGLVSHTLLIRRGVTDYLPIPELDSCRH